MKTLTSAAAGMMVMALIVPTSMAQRVVGPPVRATPMPRLTPTPPPAPEQTLSGVFKYAQTRQDSAWGRVFLVVLAAPAMGGNITDMIVPNKDESPGKLNPNDQMADILKNAKQGDYLEVTAAKFQGRWMLRSLKAYDLRPGEDEQNVFIFSDKGEQKVGQETFTTVNVSKFGQQYTMLVPNRKNSDGKVGPNEEIVRVIDGFKSGDPAEIQGERSGPNLMIRSIKVFDLPRKYVFSKIARQKVQDKEQTGVEVKDGDTPLVFLVNPKDPNASTLYRKIMEFKADQPVIVRSNKDGWLIDIKAGPKEAPKPTTAPAK